MKFSIRNPICYLMYLSFLYCCNNVTDIQESKLSASKEIFIPDNGFIPDEKTAIKIAEAIWIPIYGEEVLNHRPFVANLAADGIWEVHSDYSSNSVNSNSNDSVITTKDGKYKLYSTTSVISLGGGPYLYIQKIDGKVIKVFHSK